jgi:hypothetical protein
MLGLDYYQMDIAIISTISASENSYVVLHCATSIPEINLKPQTQFPFSETYCSFTFNADRPIGFYHANETIAEHPCYKNFQLESYIGEVYYLKGQRAGTINFSSATSKVTDFSKKDYLFIEELAREISSLLR